MAGPRWPPALGGPILRTLSHEITIDMVARMADFDSRATDDCSLPDGSTLLVVDDDPMVRRSVRRMLELSRVTVVEAADGEHAIQVIGRDEAHLLDAVVTDLDMPVVSGPELIAVLRECRPDLSLVAMSGSAELPRDLQEVPFIHKPFSPEQLTAVVEPLVLESQAIRERARQARADAAESRSLAARQLALAKEHHAAASEMMAALLRLRERRRKQSLPPAATP